MSTIKDKGAFLAALVALFIAGATYVGSQGARSQQLADVAAQVAHLEQQVQAMQGELDQYLYAHDGH